jgi:hypothetical protein
MNSLAFGKNSYSRTRNAHVAPEAHIRELESRQVLPGEIGLCVHVYPASEWVGRIS